MMSYSLYWPRLLPGGTFYKTWEEVPASQRKPAGPLVESMFSSGTLDPAACFRLRLACNVQFPEISEWVLDIVEFPLAVQCCSQRSSRLYCHMTLLHYACLNRFAVLLFGDLWSMITKLQSKSGTKRILSCLTIGCRIRQLDAGTLMKSMARVSSWQSSPRLPIAASRFKSQLAHLQQQFHGEPGMKAIATRWFLLQIQMSSPLPLALTCGPSLQVAVLSFEVLNLSAIMLLPTLRLER